MSANHEEHAAQGMPPAQVALNRVTKCFGKTTALRDATIEVQDGEILSLLGPSGCGKTTALRLIAGFDRADAGTISLAGRIVESPNQHVPAEKRRVGMVFQDYALFPHLDVAGNIGFGLPRGQARLSRVRELAELVGLTGLEQRHPRELSGGQQQRVALARALAPDPDVVLLDEPFSNLDATLRQQVRADVQRILRDATATAVFVTHAQDEALSIADRVAVMRDGRIVQLGSPDELYLRPRDPFVAAFIADATLIAGNATDGAVTTPFGCVAVRSLWQSGAVIVAMRPESITVQPDPEGGHIVVDREYYGHDEVVTIESPDGPTVRARLDASHAIGVGTRVQLSFEISPDDVFLASSSARIGAQE